MQGSEPRPVPTCTRAPAAGYSGPVSILGPDPELPLPHPHTHPFLDCLTYWSSKCSAATTAKRDGRLGVATVRRAFNSFPHPESSTHFPRGSVSRGPHILSPNLVVPAASGFQRNFPEAPGRVTRAGKEGGAGRRRGEGAGKTAESCFLSRHPHAPWLPLYCLCHGKREQTSGSCFVQCTAVDD